jgi:predicted Zn-dependent protease with MMP-like domain
MDLGSGKRGSRKQPKKSTKLPELEWDSLREEAANVVEEVIQTLPEAIKLEAQKVPCLFRKWSEDLGEKDLLGTYHGFEEGRVSEEGGRICLFLGNISQLCEEEGLEFEKEVRRTFLHELGHHLGWDEDELEKHGL